MLYKKMKNKIYQIPLYLVLLVPLVVYGKLVDTGLGEFAWFSDNASVIDVFLYHKQRAILITSCMILLFIMAGTLRKELQCRISSFWPLILYLILSVLSSVVSEYSRFAWNGMMEQYESIWVVIGYFLICTYASMACEKSVFTAFGIVSAIIGAVGTLQFFGADIYRTAFMQKLCMPESLKHIVFHVTAESGRSYCTLSNPNYAGVLCCLTIPVLTMLFILAEKWHEKVLFGISDVLMFFSLIGSRSKSGILILAGCIFLLVMLFRDRIAGRLHLSGKGTAVLIFAILSVTSTVSVLAAYRWGAFAGNKSVPETKISEISTGDEIRIVYDGMELHFSMNYQGTSLKEAVTVADENGKAYSVREQEGVLYFENKALSKVSAALVKYGGYTALELWDSTFYWYFTNQTRNRDWQYLTHYGKPDRLVSGDIAVYKPLEGWERIVSGRGYIWSRTIPLLESRFLLGSGMDSFAAAYPNNDYLGKARWGYKDLIITKPHSMYLQTAVQSGVLSLIMLLIFWGRFLIRAVKNPSKAPRDMLVKAIAVGVLGYLLMGTVNDSSVGTAPVFCLLLGLGLSLSGSRACGGI